MFIKLKEAGVNRIKRAGMRDVIAVLLVIALIISIWYIPDYVKHWKIAKQEMPMYEQQGLSIPTGTIDQDSGVVHLANSAGRELYIDTETLNLSVVDTETGIEWHSVYDDGSSGNAEKSPLIIKFLGEDSTLYEWDAYSYAIVNNRYTLHKIDNGVQIIFDFYETESYRLGEYMPTRISAENYEKHFVEQLELKLNEGEISAAEMIKYRDVLGLAYQLDQENDLYFFRFAGLPPLSLVRDLISLSRAVDYTTEMLIEESSLHGINVTITTPASFIVSMEATLDNGDLVVRIPTYEIENGNDFYTMQNISVLPAFGLASAEKVEEGYIVVPDGAGALFKLNTFNGKYPGYDRPVYNNTYYNDFYEIPDFPEHLTMPIFGMYYSELNGKSQGHMGIIEKGAELGHIKVQLGTEDTSTGGTIYNKVFSTFDAMQYSRVLVFGPYSENEARYLASTGPIDVDYTVRYKFFDNKVTYYDLAKSYQEYLVSEQGLKISYDHTPKLFLDVIGTLTLEKRLLGVPYEKNHSMTSYDQLLAIMHDLSHTNTVVNYKGVFNNGLNNSISNKAELAKANGSKKDLEALVSYFNSENKELFFNVDLMRITKKRDGFRPRSNALYGYDGKPVELRKYNYVTGWFDQRSSTQYLLNPLYLSDTVNKFISNSQLYPNVFVNDMGATFYANYNRRQLVNPVIANSIVVENLVTLAEHKTVALDNPNIDKISYAKYASNISRESSDYGTMYSSIPFRQLVMNGLTNYTTLNVNMSANRNEYFLLQAFELGSIPKFTISAENVDILKNTEYSHYFAMEYETLKDSMKALYATYSQGLAIIGSKEIVNHRMLDKNVFETTYASGVKVIVNYNRHAISILGHQLDALGYKII